MNAEAVPADGSPELSIVMPCYNEEGCIESVVRDWVGVIRLRHSDFEIVVVDDGSRDRSGAILDTLEEEIPELRVIHQANGGHGAALRRALEEARGTWVFHVDSDDQFIASDFWTLWDLRDDNDYVCGIRIRRHDPLHRLVITRVVRVLTRLFFGTRVRDANIPFKLARRSALDALLELVPNDVFAPSILITVAAAKLCRYTETPVLHRARRTGRISIVRMKLLKACLRCTLELAAFRRVLGRAAAERLPRRSLA